MADDTTATTTSTTEATPASDAAPATVAVVDAGETDAGDDASLLGAIGADAGTGDGEAVDAQAGSADDQAVDNLPETYELTMPEGVELDAELLGEADPIFRDLKLGNESVNKLMPLVGKVQERLMQGQANQHSEMAAGWAKAAKADPEYGGAKWAETEGHVARALDRFVGPAITKDDKGNAVHNEFRQLLNDTKLGNHPEMIRVFAKIGAAIGEDSDFVRGLGGPQPKASREVVMYPNDVPKT